MGNWTFRIVIGISSLAIAVLLAPKRVVGSPAMAAPDGDLVKRVAVEPPPLGWSSWNSFSNTVNSPIVMKEAKAMVDSGLQKAGYQYINIDEGWWLGQRDTRGNIIVDAKQWPALKSGEHDGDMGNIVRYVHSLRLKAGIYTDAGESGCGFYGPDLGPPAPHTGSEGHYDQDFLQFAHWGFDYVKVDWCGGSKENLDPAVQYAEIALAINRAERLTGHRLYFSICNWGNNSPWTWAPGIGGVHADIWRTSGDIVAPIVADGPNRSRLAEFKSVLGNFDQGTHPEAQHTGYYNDLDMMVLGMPGLDEAQNRVHMGLWAISGSPLLVGADLTKLSAAQVNILTNPYVLAIDQDALGLQAMKVSEHGKDLQTWCKVLMSPGSRAVLLLNRGATPARMDVRWNDIGLDGSSATVKDVWGGREQSSMSAYSSTVPAGDAILLLIRGTDAKSARYAAASNAAELRGGARVEQSKTCDSKHSVVLGGEKVVRFTVAPIRRPTLLWINYVNAGTQPLFAQLRTDGHAATNILFPPTGGEVGSVTVELESGQSELQSTLAFSSNSAAGPTLVSISTLSVGE